MRRQGMLGLEVYASFGASHLAHEVYPLMTKETFSETIARVRTDIFHEIYDEVRLVIENDLSEKWFSVDEPSKPHKRRKKRC